MADHDFPGDNLVRAVFPADLEVRDTDAAAEGMPTLTGHFAVFDEFTEISSAFEGNFMERIAPGAFTKTIRENLPNMRVLFQHGQDPTVGDKVLGVPTLVEEDDVGARYEVPLFDTSYNADLVPGLRAGAYGASFRFSVVKENVDMEAAVSESNPKGLPERTIQEARVMEFGPVTFGAYENATAGVRSLTDDFLPGGRFASGAAASTERAEPEDAAPTIGDGEPTHSHESSRDTPLPVERRATTNENEEKVKTDMNDDRNASIVEMRARQADIKRELETIAADNSGAVLSAQDQATWDTFEAEWDDLDKRCLAEENRQLRLEKMGAGEGSREAGSQTADTGTYVTRRAGKDKAPDNVFDTSAYHGLARDQPQMMRLLGDGARRAIETFTYPHPDADKAKINTHIERVLAQSDSPDKEVALRILNTGSEIYKRAFFKSLTAQPMTNDEQRALAVGAVGTGQAAVPVDLDPTLIPTSNGQLNPLRAISRVITTTAYNWKGVTSAGVTAQYRAEGAITADNSPTLSAPSIIPERADSFVPFSYEIGMDWGQLESGLAEALQDAKDTLEALKFSVGTGHASFEPRGILYGSVADGPVIQGPASATIFGVAELYLVEAALPARHIANASWVATPALFAKVRQLDTAGGGGNLWVQLADGNPPTLLGYPAYKASNVGTAGPNLTASAKWGVFGDFSKFAIVDRIGMSIEIIPHLFNGNTTGGITYPTGQRGMMAFWRNSAEVLDRNAFRVGTIG